MIDDIIIILFILALCFIFFGFEIMESINELHDGLHKLYMWFKSKRSK